MVCAVPTCGHDKSHHNDEVPICGRCLALKNENPFHKYVETRGEKIPLPTAERLPSTSLTPYHLISGKRPPFEGGGGAIENANKYLRKKLLSHELEVEERVPIPA